MVSGLTVAAVVGGSSCTTNSPPPPTVQDYFQCDPPRDYPTIDYAVVTDAAFDGGADPSGRRDCSNAVRAAVATGKPVYIPPGSYTYHGPGIDHPAPFIVGAGQGRTTVTLGPETTFIDSDQVWLSLTLRGIRFNGGVGHVKNRFHGINVTDFHTVSDCAFINYSGASISTNSVDHPYWKIEGNIFRGSNYLTSMGIALSGLTDGTTIANNAFLANRVHIKVGRGGNNTYIHNCDFLRFGGQQGVPRIDVWFTLSVDEINCGAGMVITRCKFGNEFLDERDLRIVYADETDGRMNDERWPLLDKPSTNWIGGHTVTAVFANGIGDRAPIPLVRSTTSNVVGSTYGPVTMAGNSGAPILSTIMPLRNGGHSNYVGPLLRATGYTGPLPRLLVSDHPPAGR
ncbi:hypothetical protein BHQ18_12205 [Mycolicibacterium flavescens]|uniref:Pectate lyase superfamily protein domain-containing protein n=2 Tax=Mycolicibacterium flavescens TaxID=1776 RepID=A0A1E3RK11_MYCFV|nr:hypothetical protein BHQ18_12205 [Mycolicibacterium flavescens]